ncbi:HotDog domain-containing protein [Exophiala viscosa]|uniref:HotDog domain-containing protein n=1 Tax=Exophiala viscosa TaxID=2486360 RepID=UPI00218DD0DA|nr:HotDog domain-containing protein [Exophiala viscosa]
MTNEAHTPPSPLDHFNTIPWCAELLADPSFHILGNLSRTVTSGDGHSLMAETWNTERTISHLLSLHRPLDPTAGQPEELRRLYTFGSGMNAHPDLLHGGVIATILDSTMGNAVGQQIPDLNSIFTVALNITYKKPVSTPGTVVVRSWIAKIEGARKVWVHGVIESGAGEVHALADGMWLITKAKL